MRLLVVAMVLGSVCFIVDQIRLEQKQRREYPDGEAHYRVKLPGTGKGTE